MIPPGGRSGIIHPAAPDPAQPTLHTCSDCGYQLLIPAGLVGQVADLHRRGCLGPRISDLHERLNDALSTLRALVEDNAVDESQDPDHRPR